MESQNELHVVLGATGAAGSAVVAELVRRGHPTRAVSRHPRPDGPEGVEAVAADVTDPHSAAHACAGAAVVYHCVNPGYTKWATELPRMTDAIVAGAAAAGAKLVLADNLYMYGPVYVPIREDLPAAARGKKGRVRAQMAADLLAAHAAGRVRVAIGRASDYYGPGGLATATGATVFLAAAKGKTVRWLGSLDEPHTLQYLPDVARALVTLGERPDADGEVWHLPAAEAVTGRKFIDLIAQRLGREPKVAVTTAGALKVLGVFSPLLRELKETMYQWERPFVSDATKFQEAFGPFAPTPHETAVPETVDWFTALASGS